VKPQFVPSHVAVEFAGGVHAAHEDPHELIDVLSAHAALHVW
jgi:hypothetical protein